LKEQGFTFFFPYVTKIPEYQQRTCVCSDQYCLTAHLFLLLKQL